MTKKKRKKKYVFEKKHLVIAVSIFLFLILIFFSIFGKLSCNDETLEGKCSSIKPYFCLDRNLVEKASVCGCSEVSIKNGERCFSKYQFNPKNIILEYVLRGKKREINFIVYEGGANYISTLSKTILYSGNETPLRRDFKLKRINEEEQRELLLPLVVKIQSITTDKTDQMRIAVSMVQNIPYSESDKNITIISNSINSSRYPYEVLYDFKGACEGKSELLAFLLKELGYGVALFYYPEENHEVVGIKCPVKYSLDNTGYCFVETTGPSLISNDQEYYLGLGRLSSNPEMILISEGDSLGRYLYEYKDAQDLIKLNNLIEKEGALNIFRHYKLGLLKKKYGLEYI